MKKTTQTTGTRRQTARAAEPRMSPEERMRSAYEVHTLSQMLYGHLVGHPAWGAAAPASAPEPAHGFGMMPGVRAWGAGSPTAGPEPPHGFGVSAAPPTWTGSPWRVYPGTGMAFMPGRPYCMTGYWKP